MIEKNRPLGALVLGVVSLSLLMSSASVEPPEPGSAPKWYIGSKACRECHEAHWEGWQNTLHARMEQEPIGQGPARNVLGDFSSGNPDLTFSLDDVDMLVGSRFKQRYAKRIGDEFYMLPAQWKVASGKWAKYLPRKDWWARGGIYPPEWNRRPYSKLCQGCHTTGYDLKKKVPAERNITCEACHGPGSLHVEESTREDIVNPARLDNRFGNMVCFQCHMSGRPPPGPFEKYAWPVGYVAGGDLTEHWMYAKPTGADSYEMWADGYAHKNRVQGNTFIRSKMYGKGVRCTTCHDSHGSRYTSLTIKATETNALCLTCHGEGSPQSVLQAGLSGHTHHKRESTGSRCVECHMPRTGKNAEKWDARDHSFSFVSPSDTIRHGVPNGCNNCHEDREPGWAQAEVEKWESP